MPPQPFKSFTSCSTNKHFNLLSNECESPWRLPRADVNTKLLLLVGVSSDPRRLMQFVRLSVMMLIGDYAREMMLFCTVVKTWIVKRLKKGLTDCAPECGPHSVTGRMSHSKGGSENLCVNTWHSLQKGTQRSVLWHPCLSVSWSDGHVLTTVSVMFFHDYWDTRNCFLGICFKDVRECMSVAPPTEWVCIVLWLIPPLHRPDRIRHKHAGLNASEHSEHHKKASYVSGFYGLALISW